MSQRFQRLSYRVCEILSARLYRRRIGCLYNVCIWQILQNPQTKVYGGVGPEIFCASSMGDRRGEVEVASARIGGFEAQDTGRYDGSGDAGLGDD